MCWYGYTNIRYNNEQSFIFARKTCTNYASQLKRWGALRLSRPPRDFSASLPSLALLIEYVRKIRTLKLLLKKINWVIQVRSNVSNFWFILGNWDPFLADREKEILISRHQCIAIASYKLIYLCFLLLIHYHYCRCFNFAK